MIKKQVGFQVASYSYPEDYRGTDGTAKTGAIRSEVEKLQEGGWEVFSTEFVRFTTNPEHPEMYSLNLLVVLVKYEYIDEPVAAKVK